MAQERKIAFFAFVALFSSRAEAQWGFEGPAPKLPLEVRCDLDGDHHTERVVLQNGKKAPVWRVLDERGALRFEQPASDEDGGRELTCVRVGARGALALIWRGCWGIDHICSSHFVLKELQGGQLVTVADIRDEPEDARFRVRRRNGRVEIVVENSYYKSRKIWRWDSAQNEFVAATP